MTHTHPAPDRRERGFSLIEVLVSAGVLAGVLLSISTMFIAGTQSVRSGRDMTRATTLANSAIEEVLTLPFELVYGLVGADRTLETAGWDTDSALPALSGPAADVLMMTEILESWASEVQEQLQEGLLSYRVDGVHRFPDGADDGLGPFNGAVFLRITVNVSWTEPRGRHRNVSFEALVN